MYVHDTMVDDGECRYVGCEILCGILSLSSPTEHRTEPNRTGQDFVVISYNTCSFFFCVRVCRCCCQMREANLFQRSENIEFCRRWQWTKETEEKLGRECERQRWVEWKWLCIVLWTVNITHRRRRNSISFLDTERVFFAVVAATAAATAASAVVFVHDFRR